MLPKSWIEAKEKLADDIIKKLTGIDRQEIIKFYEHGWHAGLQESVEIILELRKKKYSGGLGVALDDAKQKINELILEKERKEILKDIEKEEKLNKK